VQWDCESCPRGGVEVYTPQEELRRVEELQDLQLLDTPPEEGFDRITRLVAKVFQVPVCMVSLVDQNRQWSKSCWGLPEQEHGWSLPREDSFCQHVVALREPLVVKDALLDDRFSGLRSVQEGWIRFYAGVPLCTKKGNVLGALCVWDVKPRSFSEEERSLLADFSQWVMAEVELRQEIRSVMRSEEQLHTLVDTADEVMFQTDHNGRLMFLNPAWSVLLGWSLAESLKMPLEEFVLEEDRPSFCRQWEHLLWGMIETIQLEVRLRTRQGPPVWCECHARLTKDGEQLSVSGSLFNITANKRALQQVMEAFSEQNHILDTIPDVIYMVDLQGRLLRWNKYTEVVTGQSAESLRGLSMLEMAHPSERELIEQTFREVLRTGAGELELRVRVHDGCFRPFHWSAVMVRDRQGKSVGVTGVGKDMSDRVQMRNDMLLAGKVQRGLLPGAISNEWVVMEGIYIPFQHISGDFYDYKWTRPEVLFGYVVDIMGHGVATALQTSALRVLFRQAAERTSSLAERLSWINNSCFPYFSEEYFAAAICFEIDFVKRTLTYASAGINHFFRQTKDGMEVVKVPGAFLGMFEGMAYEQHVLPLNQGDRYVFFTDGMYEQLTVDDFGGVDFAGMVERLREVAERESRTDDATAMCFEIRLGGGGD
jgi:PAS domain S-box-containing protein